MKEPLNTTMQFSGLLTKTPVNTGKVIYLAVGQTTNQETITWVMFKQSSTVEQMYLAATLKTGAHITCIGRENLNPKTNQPQIIIDQLLTTIPAHADSSKQEPEAYKSSVERPRQDLALIHANSTTTTLKTSNAEEALLRELFQMPLGEALDLLTKMMKTVSGAGN